jgi:hypothetical protein
MNKHERGESKAYEAREEGRGGCKGKGGGRKRLTMAQSALKRVKRNVRKLAK